MEPNGTLNLSQSLFQMDEKIASANMPNMFNQEFPSFINQSRLSTYFQDNPWPTVEFPIQYGLNPMGGPINYSLPPGHKPGNLPRPAPMPSNAYSGYQNTTVPVNKNGMMVPNFMTNFPN